MLDFVKNWKKIRISTSRNLDSQGTHNQKRGRIRRRNILCFGNIGPSPFLARFLLFEPPDLPNPKSQTPRFTPFPENHISKRGTRISHIDQPFSWQFPSVTHYHVNFLRTGSPRSTPRSAATHAGRSRAQLAHPNCPEQAKKT